MRILLAIFIGSGLGGVCRYLLSGWIGSLTARWPLPRPLAEFPWGTFAVNILGCFIIGLIYGLIGRHITMSEETKLLLTTGFCGGLTTFSTFSHENFLLFSGHNHPTLILYAVASLLLGFAAAYLGHSLPK